MSQTRLDTVLDTLQARGLLDAAQKRAALDHAARHEAPTTLLARAMTALSAWIAAIAFLCAIGGCAALLGVEDEAAITFIGGALLVGATVASHVAAEGRFLRHLVLVATLAGKFSFYGGLGTLLDSEDATALAVLLTSIALAFTHADVFERTLAVYIGQASLAFWFRDDLSIGVPVVTAVALGLTFLAWQAPEPPASVQLSGLRSPLAWGGLLGLIGVRSVAELTRMDEMGRADPLAWLTPLILTAALIAAIPAVLSRLELDERRVELGGMLVFTVLGLAWFAGSEPGVLVGLVGLVLSVDQRDRARQVVSVLALIGFGIRFYYDMDLGFLAKAGVLAGSGALLLVLRAGVRWRFSELAS